MTFADKSRHDRTFQQVTHKGGESAINYIKRFQDAHYFSVSVGTLMAKFLTTAYNSNIIEFKMDEDPLQLRIYFLTFIYSLDMIFSQYKETGEVLLD